MGKIKRKTDDMLKFEQAVARCHPKASIETLAEWFKPNDRGGYAKIEVNEWWIGWQLCLDELMREEPVNGT